MAKYLFLFRGNDASNRLSPEEMQQLMRKWQAWVGEGLQKGWMLQCGERLTREGCVVSAEDVVLDGPFVESKEIVGGYAFVQADTLDAAVELARACPALLTGGSVDIRPFADLPAKP